MDQQTQLPQFRRYVAESQVGQGAFGTVYLANKKSLDDYVAERQNTRRERLERNALQQSASSTSGGKPVVKNATTAKPGMVDTELSEEVPSTAGAGSVGTPQHRSVTGTPTKLNPATSSATGSNSTNTTNGDMGTPYHSTEAFNAPSSPSAAAASVTVGESSAVVSEQSAQVPPPPPATPAVPNDEADYEDEPNRVAIKVIPNYNRNEEFARRVWLELAILHAGQAIPQVVPMYHIDCTTSYVEETVAGTPTVNPNAGGSVAVAGGGDDSNPQSPNNASGRRIPQYNLHVTMDYVPYDLANLIQKRAINSESKIRSVICQLLLGINALAERQCVHRDLSSRNVLVTNELSVFICDFGLARLYDPDEQMSYGVITQWYRAPEVLLDCKYGSQVDVWAVGVMMAELFLQGHLFMGRNKDVVHQLNCILDHTGFQNPEWMEEGGDLGSASANAKAYMKKQRLKAKGVDTMKFRLEPSQAAKDLLTNLLRFNPKERWTARKCLEEHPWFTSEPEIKTYITQQLEYIAGVENPFTMVGDSEQGYSKRISEVLKLYEEE